MQADWLALMNEIGAPRTLLPLPANLTRTQPCRGQGGANNKCTPPTIFSLEVLRIIHRIDANMFDEWGYTKRDREFELADPWGSESVADSINPATAGSVNPIAALQSVVSGEVDSINAATAEAAAEVQTVADAKALEVAVATDQARIDAKKAAAQGRRQGQNASRGSRIEGRIEGRQLRQDQAVAEAKAKAKGKAAAEAAQAGPAQAGPAQAVAAQAAAAQAAAAEADVAQVTLEEEHALGQGVQHEVTSETQGVQHAEV